VNFTFIIETKFGNRTSAIRYYLSYASGV
jgi:hypothetical protein